MNIAHRTMGVTRRRVPAANPAPSVSLPVYLSLMLLVSAVIAVVVVGWTMALRQDNQPSDPFSDYAEIMPGQPRRAVVNLGFSCNPANNVGNKEYCARALAAGSFSLVAVTLSNGIVSRVDFALREDTLKVGDLAFLWGRPRIQLYRQSAVFEWPSAGLNATGWAVSGRFTYAVPVVRISFGPSWIAGV